MFNIFGNCWDQQEELPIAMHQRLKIQAGQLGEKTMPEKPIGIGHSTMPAKMITYRFLFC